MNDKRGNRSPLGDNNGNRNGGQSFLIVVVCMLVSLICVALFSGVTNTTSSRKISYDEFIRMLNDGEVKSVVINTDTIDITGTGD